MGIERKLEMGAVNITTQPHSAEGYVRLLRAATKIRLPAKIRGERYGIFSGFHREKGIPGEVRPVSGDIVLFSRIDPNLPWFNTTSDEFASEEDIERVQIPDHLKPNSVKFAYVFFPEEHLAFFQGYDSDTGKYLTANVAKKFFEQTLNRDTLVESFGQVDVTTIPTDDAIQTALDLPQKNKMHLSFTVPNPDDDKLAEVEFQERLRLLKARKKEEVYYSESGESLQVDNDLQTLVKIAAKNGSVVVSGRDEDGKPAIVNTKEHPWRVKEYFDDGIENLFDVMLRLAENVRKKF